MAANELRKTDMQIAMNAALYFLHTGGSWHYLLLDCFPTRKQSVCDKRQI
jgi:hypothetical protein